MSLISISEMIGTIAFAISGALMGISKRLDIYGVMVLAVVTALGGGLFRDILVGNTPPAALQKPLFTIMSLLTAILAIKYHEKLTKFNNIIQFFDAIGLAAFTVIGAEIAAESRFASPFLVILLGLLTGTGGGIIRDVFVKEIPFVFRKDVYALASIFGSLGYLLLDLFAAKEYAVYTCFSVTLLIRLLSIKYNFNARIE